MSVAWLGSSTYASRLMRPTAISYTMSQRLVPLRLKSMRGSVPRMGSPKSIVKPTCVSLVTRWLLCVVMVGCAGAAGRQGGR